MVAIAATDPDQVKSLHAKALALGAQDEGAPGARGGKFYGAYFRDLDGNKLAVFCMTA
jgi:predicted lactoylglutathione lyase